MGQGWVREDSSFANLSHPFREPFADFSPKRCNFRKLCLCKGGFLMCVNQGATANLRAWDNPKLKPFLIHRQRKADVYISLCIYLSKCCMMQYTVPSMDPVAILQGKLPSIQTFGETFAVFRHAKTHIHVCKCHSDTKSLAWVLERLIICTYIYDILILKQLDRIWNHQTYSHRF